MNSMCALLEHSSSCLKPCYIANDCKKMKQLICHYFLCINKKSCAICNEINSTIHDHSSHCNLTACPVMMCSTYRQLFGSKKNSINRASSYQEDANLLKELSLSYCVVTTKKRQNESKSTLSAKTKTVYHCSQCKKPKFKGHLCKLIDTDNTESNEIKIAGPALALLAAIHNLKSNSISKNSTSTSFSEVSSESSIDIKDIKEKLLDYSKFSAFSKLIPVSTGDSDNFISNHHQSQSNPVAISILGFKRAYNAASIQPLQSNGNKNYSKLLYEDGISNQDPCIYSDLDDLDINDNIDDVRNSYLIDHNQQGNIAIKQMNLAATSCSTNNDVTTTTTTTTTPRTDKTINNIKYHVIDCEDEIEKNLLATFDLSDQNIDLSELT